MAGELTHHPHVEEKAAWRMLADPLGQTPAATRERIAPASRCGRRVGSAVGSVVGGAVLSRRGGVAAITGTSADGHRPATVVAVVAAVTETTRRRDSVCEVGR